MMPRADCCTSAGTKLVTPMHCASDPKLLHAPITCSHGRSFTPAEIVHLKYPNPLNPHYGLSPLQANALTVDANTELLKSRYQTFLVGPRPGVVLQSDQTLTDQTVTIRERDSMSQVRVSLDKVKAYLTEKLEATM